MEEWGREAIAQTCWGHVSNAPAQIIADPSAQHIAGLTQHMTRTFAGVRLLARPSIWLCLALLLLAFLFPAQAHAAARDGNTRRSASGQQPLAGEDGAQARTAHTRSSATGGVTMQIDVGFEDDSRLGYWTPVQITLSNNGADFSGTLSATTYTSPLQSGLVIGDVLPWSYEQAVSLRHGTQKQVLLSVPFYESPFVPRAILATLRDGHGKVILTQTQTPYTLRKGTLLVGILTDQNVDLGALNAVTLPSPSRSIETVTLNASTLPDMAEMLGNFDVIVLDDFPTSTLSTGQLVALETWVNQGGALIEIGGSAWQRTLSTLPAQLLPVTLHGTDTLPARTHLLPVGSPTIVESGLPVAPDTLKQPIAVSTGVVNAAPTQSNGRQGGYISDPQTILAADTVLGGQTPLLVQAREGQGIICYLAFDPTAGPFVNWSGTIALWKGLLFRVLGDQFLIPAIAPTYSNGPGQFTARDGLFQILQPQTLVPIWGFVILLAGYILLIGPVRLLIVKRVKRLGWSWRIILSCAVVFTLLTYTLAFSQRAASVNSISIIQLNEGTSWAHTTSYLSVLIPGQGNFQVRMPGRSLAQPIPDTYFPNGLEGLTGSEEASVTLGQNETDVNLLNIGDWTLHPIVSEQDQHLPGGITAHLTLRDGMLIGTITNTLGSSLNDVYVLLPHGFASIGQLPAGGTRRVNIPLHSQDPSAGTTLADQIASSNGLPAPYFPYAHGMQQGARSDCADSTGCCQQCKLTSLQRHVAILSALSGEGDSFSPCSGPCSTHAIVTKHAIVTPLIGGPTAKPIDGNDPLLISGAPATLIGWTDQPLSIINGVTINGSAPTGSNENLLQVPLNINLSALANTQPDPISAQVINAEGSDVATTAPDVYSMTAGSITFEFVLPIEAAHVNSMTIREPFISAVQGICRDKGMRGEDVGASCLSILLYNWSTSSWDSITLNRDSHDTSVGYITGNLKAYTSPDGRVLLRQSNRSSAELIFSKPSLSLNV